MSARDIVDEIDALIDEQLRGGEYEQSERAWREIRRCPHCSREWHGLAITARLEQMRSEYRAAAQRREWAGEEPEYAESAILDGYRYDEDDSEVLCPGSTFIGPIRPRSPILGIHWHLPDDPFDLANWMIETVLLRPIGLYQQIWPAGGGFLSRVVRDPAADVRAVLAGVDLVALASEGWQQLGTIAPEGFTYDLVAPDADPTLIDRAPFELPPSPAADSIPSPPTVTSPVSSASRRERRGWDRRQEPMWTRRADGRRGRR